MKHLLFLLLCLFTTPLPAQPDFTTIDQFLEQERQRWNIPTIALGITTPDSTIYLRSYGAESSGDLFLIGSLSKPFTALAVMQLVERGQLALDQPVRRYLPWFATSDTAQSNRITVRHLLNQTGGLPKSAGFFTPTVHSQADIEQAYAGYLRHIQLVCPPGQRHEYCNLNYQLLGQLVRQASGEAYGGYLRQHILQPLEMDHTFASANEAHAAGLRTGHQYWFGFPAATPSRLNDNGTAAGDIASTPADLCIFLRAMLRGGKYGSGDSLVSAATLRQMHTPVSVRYGMGWSIGPWNDLPSIRHTGLSRNFSAAINLLPEQGYGIVLLTDVNSFYAARNLMDGVIRRLNGQELIAYPPYELYARYFFGMLLLWTSVEFLLYLRRWRRLGFAVTWPENGKGWFGLVAGLVMAGIWLVMVPRLADIPLLAMPVLQPDLGVALLAGGVIGILSTLVKHFVKNRKSTAVVRKTADIDDTTAGIPR